MSSCACWNTTAAHWRTCSRPHLIDAALGASDRGRAAHWDQFLQQQFFRMGTICASTSEAGTRRTSNCSSKRSSPCTTPTSTTRPATIDRRARADFKRIGELVNRTNQFDLQETRGAWSPPCSKAAEHALRDRPCRERIQRGGSPMDLPDRRAVASRRRVAANVVGPRICRRRLPSGNRKRAPE